MTRTRNLTHRLRHGDRRCASDWHASTVTGSPRDGRPGAAGAFLLLVCLCHGDGHTCAHTDTHKHTHTQLQTPALLPSRRPPARAAPAPAPVPAPNPHVPSHARPRPLSHALARSRLPALPPPSLLLCTIPCTHAPSYARALSRARPHARARTHALAGTCTRLHTHTLVHARMRAAPTSFRYAQSGSDPRGAHSTRCIESRCKSANLFRVVFGFERDQARTRAVPLARAASAARRRRPARYLRPARCRLSARRRRPAWCRGRWPALQR